MKKCLIVLMAFCMAFFTVIPATVSAGQDTTPPVLNSISVIPAEGISDETEFTIIADISDEVGGSGVGEQLEVIYYSGRVDNETMQSYSIALEKNDQTGKYEGILVFGKEHAARSMLCGYISVSDAAGNTAHYSTREDEINKLGLGLTIVAINADMDITLTDFAEDNVLPILSSFAWNSHSLNTPCVAKLNVVATDNTSIRSIRAKIVGSDGNEKFDMAYSYGASDKGSNVADEYVLSHSFSRYTDSEDYSVKSIEIIDGGGNKSVYSVDADTESGKQTTQTIKIVNDNNPNLFTSTTEGYVDEIQKLLNGNIAVVDISGGTEILKELFDAIKGKNITVVFEKIMEDGQGIQWIIKGTDIINDTKDIDVDVFIEQTLDDTWLQKQEVKHGSRLPVLGSGNMSYEEQDRIQKQMLTDGGWGDIIPEVETCRQDGESFSNALFKLMDGSPYLRMVFQENGLLPGKSTIRINTAYATRNILGTEGLGLYYYNQQTGEYELVQDAIASGADQYYEFEITHNSVYTLSRLRMDGALTGNINDGKKGQNVKTGDDSNMMLFAVLAATSAIAAGAALLRRKKG